MASGISQDIDIQPKETLGNALKQRRLYVDVNQRSYAWEDKQIDDLYGDFESVINSSPEAEHFLGSVIVTRNKDGKPKVVDGQQRLATTTILLAAMRDYFELVGDEERAKSYETLYLYTRDPDNLEYIAHLNLNGGDNAFFHNRVLISSKDPTRGSIAPSKPSHDLILDASEKAAQVVRKIVGDSTSGASEKIARWRRFIEEKARVIWIEVPDDNAAFVIFETMNDRGLQLSAADLLKNFLFALAGDRMPEVQEKWFNMVGALESVSDSPDILVTYIRHLWVSTRGHVTLKTLYSSIKADIRRKEDAISFADDLLANASVYSALSNPNAEQWNSNGDVVRKAIDTLQLLSGDQIKPLLLSVAARFSKEEMPKALVMLVNWSVRFLISGGLGGGVVETRYGKAARAIRGVVVEGEKNIDTTQKLHDELVDIVASDVTFRTDFERARSSKSALARYYLRSIERKLSNINDWQLVPRDEPQVFNAEHIMPYNMRTRVVPPAWQHIPVEVSKALYNRIGNFALLEAKKNVAIGDKDFLLVKVPVFKDSSFKLTNEIASETRWDVSQIENRQKRLAELAVKTWPLKAKL